MADKTGIQWTDASWNAMSGCDRISTGCRRCYALKMAARLKLMGSAHYQNDGDPRTSGPGFGFTQHEDALEIPSRWTRPRKIFVNSMSDMFHEGATDEFIDRMFGVMAICQRHQFQILTKRPDRMAEWFAYDFLSEGRSVLVAQAAEYLTHEWGWKPPLIWDARDVISHGRPAACDRNFERRPFPVWPLPNVWLGVSIEMDRFSWRADVLRNTPASIRFVSAEPLLGPLPSLDLTGINWLICGAESGDSAARPMNMDWVRDLRDRCKQSGTAFFLKQDAKNGKKIPTPELDGETWINFPTVSA